jgi:hypothetical protein
MSIGSISSSVVASAYDMLRQVGEGRGAEAAASGAGTDRLATGERGTIRSASTTQGTLVDTYL